MIYFIVDTNSFRGIGMLLFRRLHYFSKHTFSIQLRLRSVAGEVRRNKHIFGVGEVILNEANKC